MSHSFDHFIAEALSSLIYGWSWHEIVYKRRQGPWQKDGRRRSKFADDLIGWRKFPIRAQETMQRWIFDESGDVRGMVQLAPPDYKMRVLPIQRSLLIRNGAHKNSPEGVSLLRTAYRPWFYKKRLEEFEAIGVERDLAGLPMVKVPASYLKAKPGTDQAKMVDAFRKMVRGLRRNEQEGLVFPTAFDPDTKQPQFDFQLLGSGGARQFSTDPLIQRYEQRILMSVLADWIMVGHEQTGTYNMHVDKRGAFQTALNAMAGSIADVLNRHAIPRLFLANGWKPDTLPTFHPSDVDEPNLTELGQFLATTAQLGYAWGPDADIEKYLRRAAGLPELGEDDYRKRQKEARTEEATRFAEEEVRYLAARSQLVQAVAQEEATAMGQPSPEEAQGAANAHDQRQAMQFQQQQQAQQGQMQQQQQQDQRQQQFSDNRRAEEQHQMTMMQGGQQMAQDQQKSSNLRSAKTRPKSKPKSKPR
jgi:hypothetical protein